MLETERTRLKQLVAKLDQLAADGFEGVSDPALQDLLAECCEATSALQAVTASVVGEWDARLLWASDGATSPQAWLRNRGEMEHTKPLVDTAQVLRDHAPATAAALAAGTISYEKADAIATAVRTDTSVKLAAVRAAYCANDVQALLASTRQLTIKETRARAAHWRTTTLAALGDDPHERAQARRELRIWRTRDGLLGFKGFVGPDEAPAVAAVLEAKANQLWHDDVRHARAEAGLDTADDNREPHGVPLARTTGQRMVDGFAELVLAGATETAQARLTDCIGGPSAVVHLTVDANTLVAAAVERVQATLQIPGLDHDDQADLQKALAALPEVHPARRVLDGPLPALDGWDTPPDLATVSMLACDSKLQRIILDSAGLPLDLGRQYRLATPAQRRALIIRDGGCGFPGCDRPAHWCDAHHIIPYEIGGLTNLKNLVLLCRKHHRKMHAKRPWHCHITPDTRLPEFYDPDGHYVPKHPPPETITPTAGARAGQPPGTDDTGLPGQTGPPGHHRRREFRRVA